MMPKQGRVGIGRKAMIVSIVGGVIALAVLLALVMQFKPKLEAFGPDKACQANLVVSALAKKATVVGAQVIPVECQPREILIQEADMTRSRLTKAGSEVKQLKTKRQRTYIESGASSVFTDPSNAAQARQWYVSGVLAKEIKSCWERMMYGNVDAFDEWPDDFLQFLKSSVRGFDPEKNSITTCVLCSRIQQSVDGEENLPIGEYLKSAIVQTDVKGRTYEEFFQDTAPQSAPLSVFYQKKIPTNKPLAVVFIRHTKPHGVKQQDEMSATAPWYLNAVSPSYWIREAATVVSGEGSGRPPAAPEVVSLYSLPALKLAEVNALNVLQITEYTDEKMGLERCQVFIG